MTQQPYTGPEAYQLYKFTKTGTGGGFSLSFSDNGLFLKIAKQMGTQRLCDWKNATTIVLQLPDIAELLLAVRTQSEINILHDAGKSSRTKVKSTKTLKVTWNEQYKNYYFELYEKIGESTKAAAVPIAYKEGLVLQSLLQYAIPFLLKWHLVDPSYVVERTGILTQTTPLLTDADRMSYISHLAKTKLFAQSAADVKNKVFEATSKKFTKDNLPAIIDILEKI